jgi:hypothetical protein
MSFTVTAIIHENVKAQELIERLQQSGIARERIEFTSDDAPETIYPDQVSSWSAGGLLVGMSIGGLLGWLLLPAGVPSTIGSLWCAVAGAIIGGRALGYFATDHGATPRPPVPQVVVAVHTDHRPEVTAITSVLTSGGAERVRWSEDLPPKPVVPAGDQ